MEDQASHRHAVLVVDDYDDARRAFVLYLDALGYEGYSAVDGPDALRQFADGLRPCCVVIDVAMPHMDGWDLTERIRADPALTALPVLMYSGYVLDPADAPRAEALGLCAYLLKPVEPPALLATIEKHCHECEGATGG